MEYCVCGRTFRSVDAINQHLKSTKRQERHEHKTKEEIQREREEMMEKALEKFYDVKSMLDVKLERKTSL